MSFKSLSILLNLLTIGLVLIPIILLSRLRLQVIQEYVCQEPVCINYSSELRDSMNRKVRPCKNFYRHVCGKWINEQKKSNFTRISKRKLVSLKTEGQIKTVLNESWDHERNDINHNIIKSKSSSVKLAVFMYHKCLTSAKYRTENPTDEELNVLLRKWSTIFPSKKIGWPLPTKNVRWDLLPEKNVLELLSEYYSQFGLTPSIEIKRFYYNDETPVIGLQLDAGSKNLFAYLNATKSANITADESDLVKLSDLNNQTRLNWVQFLNRLAEFSQANMHREFKDHDKVYVQDRMAFTLVFDNIQKKPYKIQFYNHLYREARIYLIKFQQEIKKTDCFTMISKPGSILAFTVARIWIDRFVKIGTRLKVMQITSEIKRATVEILKESQIFDTNTRNRVINKVLAIVDDIAFPEWILTDEELDYYNGIDDRLIPDTFYECSIRLQQIQIRKVFQDLEQKPSRKYKNTYLPTTRLAYYSPGSNMIHILASMLSPPLFDVDLPFYVNFAGIGFTIGHEIFHSLDPRNIHKDWIGKRVMLPIDFVQKFKNLTKCFEIQYNKVFDPIANINLNGSRTLREDLADFGGLLTSYRAFNNLLKDYRDSLRPIPILPDFTNYTIDQVFFLAYSFRNCILRSKKDAIYMIKNAGHSPVPYRVNEVLKNIEPFAKAFSCPKPSKMISRKKCSIW